MCMKAAYKKGLKEGSAIREGFKSMTKGKSVMGQMEKLAKTASKGGAK